MSTTRIEIDLDDEILTQADDLARTSGSSRDTVLVNAVRRSLDCTPEAVLANVEARSGFGAEQNVAVAQAQAAAQAVEREALRSS